jgi:hypothetical protein
MNDFFNRVRGAVGQRHGLTDVRNGQKLQVCSVSIDWWPRYTVHEIVIEGAYRAELPEIALCPMPGYSTTAIKFKLRHYRDPGKVAISCSR